MCLSHKRWKEAPDLVFKCPRLAPNGPGSEKTCDDWQGAAAFDATVRLFNESFINALDAGS